MKHIIDAISKKNMRAFSGKEVKYAVTDNDCWECTSHFVNPQTGYPMTKHKARNMGMHRRVYIELIGKDLPFHKCVMHKCDNRLCINPDHLTLGTRQDNTRDMVKKGRQGFGKTHGKAKFTDEEILKIRKMEGSTRGIAKIYGVTGPCIRAIQKRITWKHLP